VTDICQNTGAPPNDALANGMRAGSLAVACLADVPDGPILGRNAAGVIAALRTPEPGQLYKYHLGRLDWVDEMVANHGLRAFGNRSEEQQPLPRATSPTHIAQIVRVPTRVARNANGEVLRSVLRTETSVQVSIAAEKNKGVVG
jgi:hypothetical protein